MELKVWVKTFFSIYRWLDKLAKVVDGYVSLRGIACFHKDFRAIALSGTEKVVNDITGLMNKKINLINMKVLCDKILRAMPEKLARFVVAKYIDNHTFEETAEILGVNIRTANRWNLVAVEKSVLLLKQWGYSQSTLLELVDYEKWILQVAKSIEQQHENKHSKNLTYFVICHEAEKAYKKFMI